MSNTNTTTQANTSNFNSGQVCTTVAFDNICEPGAYICNWSGHLLRVPEDGVSPGRSPMLNIVAPEPLFVTKISDNPFITVTKAKLMASNYDLCVNF
ncbi:MAG: hypothetical protein ACYSUQ_07315 [Planctomycetota bacterium]|jgi:hypothetical protein